MKNKTFLAALLASALVLPAYAQPSAGAIGTVKVALTLRTGVPGTFERDDNGKFIKDEETNQKIPTASNLWQTFKGETTTTFQENSLKARSAKYGNKELLLDLLEAGILPDTGIKGWSLKYTTFGGSQPSVFLSKKDTPIVSVSAFINLASFTDDGNDPSISFLTLDQLIATTEEEGEEPVYKIKSQVQVELLTGFRIEFDGIGGKLFGLALQSQKVAQSKSKQPVAIIKVSLPAMAGKFETEDGSTFAKGSIQFGAGTIVEDMEAIFGAP